MFAALWLDVVAAKEKNRPERASYLELDVVVIEKKMAGTYECVQKRYGNLRTHMTRPIIIWLDVVIAKKSKKSWLERDCGEQKKIRIHVSIT